MMPSFAAWSRCSRRSDWVPSSSAADFVEDMPTNSCLDVGAQVVIESKTLKAVHRCVVSCSLKHPEAR